ncbi:MAG: sugar phosphate isomerase/epimerase family protein [Bacillota bacterium]
MKISFSTLGCPEWSFEDIVVTAKDLGVDGIEIRGMENELYVPKAKPFVDENLHKTIEKLQQLSIEIPCLTSSCFLFDKQNQDYYLKEGKDYIDLASRIGTPFIRVLGDRSPEPKEEIDTAYVAENLWILAKYAETKNVKVLVETNGCFANSDEMLKLLVKVDSPSVGVLWDIHHPYRFMNEPVEKTCNMLKDYISFVHIKDSIIESNKLRYKMLGYGDIPVKEAISLLKNNGYKGYVSLEWVKRWCADLEEPGIVFSHYATHIRDLIG